MIEQQLNLHKYRFNVDLLDDMAEVLDKYADKISLAEAIGILEILKNELLERHRED